jgi:uncharacterized protein (TIGR02145 family)
MALIIINNHQMKKLALPLFFVLLTVIAVLVIGCEKATEDNPTDPDVPIDVPNCGTIQDVDGNAYNTVSIGDQCWMRENLKTAHYNNGDLIGSTVAPTTSIVGEETPKYEWVLDGDTEYLANFGRVYTWYVTVDPRGICPQGWHVPTDADWLELEIALGMLPAEASEEGARGYGVGSRLAGGKSLWNNPQSSLLMHDGFGTSGFDGLPGGARNAGGYAVALGFSTYWWTSTLGNTSQYSTDAYSRYINSESAAITRVRPITSFGLYVRCVKD